MADGVRQYHTIRLADRNRGHLFTVVDGLYTSTWMPWVGRSLPLKNVRVKQPRRVPGTKFTCNAYIYVLYLLFYDYVVTSRCRRCLRNGRVIFRNVSFGAFPSGCVHICVNEQTRTEENKMFSFLGYTIK